MVGKRKGILITAFIAIYREVALWQHLSGPCSAPHHPGNSPGAGAILILLSVAIPTSVAEVAEELQEWSIEMIMVIVLTAVRS